MSTIEKKLWPKFFGKLGKIELRLADFKLKKGDLIIFKEWNPKTKKYTGRSFRRKVKSVKKDFPTNYWSKKEIEKYGVYVIELKK